MVMTINAPLIFPISAEEEPGRVGCYPDPHSKVTVELGEGAMLEYDATGYLMNHHSRELRWLPLGPDAETAKKNVSPLLSPQNPSAPCLCSSQSPRPGAKCCAGNSSAKTGTAAKCWSISTRKAGWRNSLYLLQKDFEHGVRSQSELGSGGGLISLRYAFRIKAICPPYFYEGGRKMMIRIEKQPGLPLSSETQ